MFRQGIIFIGGLVTVPVVGVSLLVYLLFGKCVVPFVFDTHALLLIGGIFLVIAAGTIVGINMDAKSSLGKRNKKHSLARIAAASLFCGCLGSLLINATLHCLLFLDRLFGFVVSLLLTGLGLYFLICCLFIAMRLTRRQKQYDGHP
jgi:hypothetical protein